MRGFTLIELIIYLAIGSIMFASVIPFSIQMEKGIEEVEEILKEAQTADLVFKAYRNSSSAFICDEKGARLKYTDSLHQIGEIESTDCRIEDHKLTFMIKNKQYSESLYVSK